MAIEPKLPRRIGTRKNREVGDLGMSKKEFLDFFVKIPVGMIALFYATGIFVQSLYFRSFGIVNLNLFKISYVLAGLWFYVCFAFIPIVFTLITLLLINNFLTQSKDKSKIHKFFYSSITILISLLSVLLTAYVSFYHLPFIEPPDALRNRYMFDMLLFTGCSIAIYASIFAMVRKTKFPRQMLVAFSMICLSLAGLAGFFVMFSNRYYKLIPAQVGGGKLQPVIVSFELDSKNAEWLRNIGSESEIDNVNNNEAPVNKDGKKVVSLNCRLILETTDGYYFQSDEVLYLPRNKVSYIIYDPKKFND